MIRYHPLLLLFRIGPIIQSTLPSIYSICVLTVSKGLRLLFFAASMVITCRHYKVLRHLLYYRYTFLILYNNDDDNDDDNNNIFIIIIIPIHYIFMLRWYCFSSSISIISKMISIYNSISINILVLVSILLLLVLVLVFVLVLPL